tara:strand:- start:3745 stop:4275 length:531 start_codon:yes stop_codon:yes gene_type:complete
MSSLNAIFASVEPSLTNAERIVKIVHARRLQVVLLQGPPGCGKSTVAREVANLLGKDCIIVSADHAFERKDGTFKFDADRLPDAHGRCQSDARKGISDGKVVLVDNTNIKVNHVKPYLAMVVPSRIIVVRISPINEAQAHKCATRGIHAPAAYSIRTWKDMETIPGVLHLNLNPVM